MQFRHVGEPFVPILGPVLGGAVGWESPHSVSTGDPVLFTTFLAFAAVNTALTAALVVIAVAEFEAIRIAGLIGCFPHARHLPSPSSSPLHRKELSLSPFSRNLSLTELT